MSNAPLWYLYCVLRADTAPDELGEIGIGTPPARVFRVRSGDLAALVSETQERNPEPVAENVLAHERTVAAAMSRTTIIPFAFGYAFPPSLVTRFLDETRSECHRLLTLFDNKIEVGLKVFWKQEHFLSDIETPELSTLRRQSPAGGAESNPLVQMRLGEKVHEAAESRRAFYRARLHTPLARAAVAAVLGEILNPRMVLNASYLIDRKDEEAFDRLVNQVAAPFLDGLDFQYTGPWPPYHFVTVRIRLEDE